MVLPFNIVPLDPAPKGGAYGALAGQNLSKNNLDLLLSPQPSLFFTLFLRSAVITVRVFLDCKLRERQLQPVIEK